MKPFLILQLRPEDTAADGEFDLFLKSGGLKSDEVTRIRMEKDGLPELNPSDYSAVIVGGGPYNVSDSESKKPTEQKRFEKPLYPLLQKIIEADFPYLGACYGLGALAKALGGEVSKQKYSEVVGPATIALTDNAKHDPLTADLPGEFRAFLGHKEACQAVPPGAELLASGSVCPVQVIRVNRNIYATQFHPEADPEGFATRIEVYKHAGYFPPEDASRLVEIVLRETVTAPVTMLQRFVTRYRQLAQK